MANVISMEINNGRTMQLTQQEYDGKINLATFHTKSGLYDHEEEICPGDMVMLINYYRDKKQKGEPLF